MKYFLLKKIGAVLGIVFLLMFTLEMVSGVISERTRYRNDAKYQIAQSWTGEQKVIGPILIVPYHEQINHKVWDKKLEKEVIQTITRGNYLYLIPEQLDIVGDVPTEIRYKGIYTVPVYTSQLNFKGAFNNQALIDLVKNSKNKITWQKPYLAINVGDIRGIPKRPELSWNNQNYKFMPGTNIKAMSQGIHAPLPLITNQDQQQYSFEFDINLRGMEHLSFSPVADNAQVSITSDWPHPSFNGRYLPEQRQISAAGFTSNWRVSSLSSDIDQQLAQCVKGECAPLLSNTFGVTLIQPIDVYQQSERSTKYAILFICLTFAVFFVFEILKNLRIHPIQYLLVGMALVLFYLLLVSLSEHITFAWAYLIASSACSVLLGVYLSGVLRNLRQGLLLSSMIALLYGLLFIILNSEDMALLMGSFLLFSTLAALMVITRKIDWYSLSPDVTTASVNFKSS